MLQQEEHVQLFTATILESKHLLKHDKYKQIILDSLKFLVAQKRVKVYGFVIMINHIHIIWHIHPAHKRENVQRDFLKYTAQQMKSDLEKHHPEALSSFLVNVKDRKYQVWERNSLSVDLWSRKVLWQKLQYMHQNPVRAGVCRWPEQYQWSSAVFTHVMD
jgi:REP element-mobilizing transposase RayT